MEIEMTQVKMTQEKVQEMRRLYGEGATQGALARHFQLGIAQVGRIVRGECWMKGAGLRLPTEAEKDATLRRLLLVQEQVNARTAADAADPLAAEVLGGIVPKVERRPPPMLLDGGDAPDEAGGEGLKALEEKAQGTEHALDKLLGPGGPYAFARKE